jgi:SynChlorMet cassette protein ScmD
MARKLLEVIAVEKNDRPIANPVVVLREEFDDWAVLFNPDAALGFAGFGLNPTGVQVWKLLNGERTIDELVHEMRRLHEGLPEEARDQIGAFVDALVTERLAAYGDTGLYPERTFHFNLAALNGIKPCTYEPPKLINLSSGQAAQGACGTHGSQTGVDCWTGAAAAQCCNSGSCGAAWGGVCCGGTCGYAQCQSGTNACDSWCVTGYGNTPNCGTGETPTYVCSTGNTAGNGCIPGNGT